MKTYRSQRNSWMCRASVLRSAVHVSACDSPASTSNYTRKRQSSEHSIHLLPLYLLHSSWELVGTLPFISYGCTDKKNPKTVSFPLLTVAVYTRPWWEHTQPHTSPALWLRSAVGGWLPLLQAGLHVHTSPQRSLHDTCNTDGQSSCVGMQTSQSKTSRHRILGAAHITVSYRATISCGI